MERQLLLNADFALEWGLNIRQAILYNWLVNNTLAWKIETHGGIEFRLLPKDVVLANIKPAYQSINGLSGALLKMQSLNLIRIGRDKDRFAICMNADLLYQWHLAHSTLGVNHGKD